MNSVGTAALSLSCCAVQKTYKAKKKNTNVNILKMLKLKVHLFQIQCAGDQIPENRKCVIIQIPMNCIAHFPKIHPVIFIVLAKFWMFSRILKVKFFTFVLINRS